MAITHTQTQVTWSAASSLTVASATEAVSDAVTIDSTCVALSIQVSADNAGTPASGDTAVWRIQWSTDGGTNYDTSEHAQYLTTLDTYATNTPGEDPARRTVDVPPTATKFKLAVTCANAATRNVVVTARVDEQRAA
jgi:hypothetical protein